MNNKRIRLSEQIKRNITYINVSLLSVIVLIGSVYLLYIGRASQMGYSFTLKEQEYTELKTKNELLKLQVLKASSYSEMTNRISLRSMNTSEPEYFETRQNRLSKK